MKSFEDIEVFLPKYLSAEKAEDLFKNLADFPDNINKIFTASLSDEDEVFQGDGLRNIPNIRLPDPDIFEGPVMVISNTCDISAANVRMRAVSFVYCPIVKVSSYESGLRDEGIPSEKVAGHIETAKKQRLSDIFFLPHSGKLPEDCFAFLGDAMSCDASILTQEKVRNSRLYSLSNYGFYMLLFKLGVHFTRVREEVDRDA